MTSTGAAGTGTGGAQGTGAQGTGAQGTGAQGTGGTGPKDSRLNTFKIPEKFSKEPWANEVKSVEDLWDKMHGAQKLIGKDKVPIPGENATQDELNAFYIRMGRPETADGYEFKSIAELQVVDRNKDLDGGMKKIFFDNGISKKAGEKIVNEYEALVYSMHKPTIDAAAQRNLDFQKLADEVLGADKVAATEAFKSTMRESLGDKAYLADKLEQMSNEELLPLIVFSKNIHDKYTGENKMHMRPGQSSQMTGDLKTDFQALSAQKLQIKMDKNMPEHIKKIKIANINTAIIKIGGKASEQNIDLFK